LARLTQEEEEEDHLSTYPLAVILRCFVVRIWLRLDSSRALHGFLIIDHYPYDGIFAVSIAFLAAMAPCVKKAE
jgi:hypothetical protein